MAKKKQRSSAYLRTLYSDAWFGYYQRTLKNLVYQMFEWKGLPETINPFFLEKGLHENGYMVFYDDPFYSKMCLQGAIQDLNPYQEPITFHASMLRYNKQIDLYTFLTPIDKIAPKDRNENLGVLCKNQFAEYESSNLAIRLFAGLLAENKQTMLISQNTLKIPFLFKGTEEQRLTFKNMYDKLSSNEPYFIVDEETGLSTESFDVVNTNAPYNLDKLNDNRMEIMNEFLTYFGINNQNISKRERLVTSEANANNEQIIHNRNKFLAPRKECARILSEAWGLDITVDLRENIVSELLVQDKNVGEEIDG